MSISSDIIRIKGAKDDLKTAINAKGGTLTTELIDDYPAAVDAISTGTDTSDATAAASDIVSGETAYAGGVKLTGTRASIHLPDAASLYGIFNGSAITGAQSLYAPSNVSWRNLFYHSSSLTSLTLLGYKNPNHLENAFRSCTVLSEIIGALDLSMCTNVSTAFYAASALVTVSIVPSTIKINISFNNSPLLSTTSLLSIANGLDAGTPATLTMHATSKTNMGNINVDVVDGVAVIGTTKTLMQFVNTDKGWTVA